MKQNISILALSSRKHDPYFPTTWIGMDGAAKVFWTSNFTKWLPQKVYKGFEEDNQLEDNEIKLTLSTLKPLHASWVCEIYSYLTSSKCKRLIGNDRRRAGIVETLGNDSSKLPTPDSFHSIDVLIGQVDSFISFWQKMHHECAHLFILMTYKDMKNCSVNQAKKKSGSIHIFSRNFLNYLKKILMRKLSSVYYNQYS